MFATRRVLTVFIALMAVLTGLSTGNATDWEAFVGESMWTVSHTTQFVLDDPANRGMLYRDLWETFNTRRWSFSDIGIQTGMEVTTSPTQSAVVTPLKFRYYRFRCNVILPWAVNRTVDYSRIDASKLGIGDIRAMVGYPIKLWKTDVYGNVGVKVPTGSFDATDGSYLTPFGSGTWDYFIGLQTTIRIKRDQWIYLDTQYHFNGDQEYRVYNNGYRTDIEMLNPNLFTFTSSYVRTFGKSTSAFLAGTMFITAEGESRFNLYGPSGRRLYGSWTNDQQVVCMELTPGFNYDIWLVTVRGMVTVPLYLVKDSDNLDDHRKWSARLGVSYFL